MNRVLRHPHQRFQLPNTPSTIRRLRVIRWLRSVSAKLKGFPRVAFAEAAPCLPGATAELSPAPAVPRGYRDAATAGLQTAPRVGAVESDPVLGRSDTWQNILANKIAAVFRYEPKDVADIWIIARNRGFAWGEVISDALRKEGGIDPVALHSILRTVPREELARVAWASPVDLSGVSADLKLIADDILYRRANSLFPR